MFTRHVIMELKAQCHDCNSRTLSRARFFVILLRKQKGFRDEYQSSSPVDCSGAIAISFWDTKEEAGA